MKAVYFQPLEVSVWFLYPPFLFLFPFFFGLPGEPVVHEGRQITLILFKDLPDSGEKKNNNLGAPQQWV